MLKHHLNLGMIGPDGTEFDISSQALEKNGQPILPVMGEIHYSRLPRNQWHDRLVKMKASGITVVSTYVIWLHHEERENQVSWAGRLDLRAFIQECQKLGLAVWLRIGPWCHGEVRNGGFPDWVMKKPFPLRTTNQDFLNLVKTWYGEIAQQVADLCFANGGSIIGIQLDNEVSNDAPYLSALKKLAVASGLKVPYYSVTGWNNQYGAEIPVKEVLPMFGGYPGAPWAPTTDKIAPSVSYVFSKARNDSVIGSDLLPTDTDKNGWRLPYEQYPYATCELGGGMQNTHHRRYLISGMDIYAPSLVKLGSGSNLIGYYMYAGGTNPLGQDSTFQESVASGYGNDLPMLSYDFQAPISEFGEIRPQYRLVNLLHLFVNDFGTQLAAMPYVPAEKEVLPANTRDLRYAMRTDGQSGFVFVNHYQREEKLQDVKNVRFAVPGLQLPAIDVTGDTAFILPFNLKLADQTLTCATAQLLCHAGSTYFFTAIPGIAPTYHIGGKVYQAEVGPDTPLQVGGLTLITLTFAQAQYLRKIDGTIYLGNHCDLLADASGVHSGESGAFAYGKWYPDLGRFMETKASESGRQALVTQTPVSEPAVSRRYFAELNVGGGRQQHWERIRVSSAAGLVALRLPACDVMQLYADGQLIADNFYYGKNWQVPAKLLYQKECYLAYSNLRDDCYREF